MPYRGFFVGRQERCPGMSYPQANLPLAGVGVSIVKNVILSIFSYNKHMEYCNCRIYNRIYNGMDINALMFFPHDMLEFCALFISGGDLL